MIVSETEPHKGTTRWYQWRIAQLERDYSALKEVSDTHASDWFEAMDALNESEFDKKALTQERDELRLTNERQAQIIANLQDVPKEDGKGFVVIGIILCSIVTGVVSFLIGRAL